MKRNPLPLTTFLRRECGDCKVCCTHMGVESIGKPINAKCVHVCDTGCSIQSNKPIDCSEYACMWLIGMGIMDASERPDKAGFMLTTTEERGKIWIDAHYLTDANDELTDRVVKTIKRIIKKYPGIYGARFIHPRQVMNHDYKIDEELYGHKYTGQNLWAIGPSDILGPEKALVLATPLKPRSHT